MTPKACVLACAVGILAVWCLTVPTARAQSKKRQPKVIQLEEIRIEGRVQKPNAFYILNRSQLGYEVMDLRTSFLKKIVRETHKEPF